MKKIGVLLLCALLAASVMTACQNGGKDGNSSQTSSAASSAQTSSAPASSAEETSSQATSSQETSPSSEPDKVYESGADYTLEITEMEPAGICLLYTSPSPRDA